MSKKRCKIKEYYEKTGDKLNKNNAIVNYIRDKFGFKIGVIVAMPGTDKNTPKIGWALMSEVPHRINYYSSLKDTPYAKDINDMLNENKSYSYRYVFNNIFNLNLNTYSKDPVFRQLTFANDKARSQLIQLAIDRANCDSWNYYVSKDVNLGQYLSDLRNDKIGAYFCHTRVTMYPGEVWETDNCTTPEINADYANMIRKKIRKVEYRAWRYFK